MIESFRHLSDVEYLAILWLVSTAVVVGFSVYSATRKPNQINFVLALVALLIGKLGYAVALVFPARLYAQLPSLAGFKHRIEFCRCRTGRRHDVG